MNTPQDVITCKRDSLFDDQTLSALPQCIPMNATEIGLVGSIFTLGGFAGALVCGPISAKYGRLVAMRITTLPFVVGPVFEALALNIPTMAIGRFISGLGAGAAMVVVPIYISEVAPPAEKGLFGSFTQIMVNVGILVAQVLGYFLSYGQFWRIVLGAGGIFGVIQVFGLFAVPESPKWTADQGHPATARKVLRKIRGAKFDIEDEVNSWGAFETTQAEEEEELLSNNSLVSPSNKGAERRENLSMFQVLRHPLHHKAVVAVIMVMMAQQLTGINSIIMYGVNLLASLLQSNSAVLNLAVSALNIVMTGICAPLVDKLGRKICLLQSIGGMGVASLLLAFGISRHVPILSAVAVILFVGSFGLGLGPVPFILSSELVSQEAVAATQSWALAANWIATFVVAQFFPIVNEALKGGKVYFIFAGLAAFFFAFVIWFVPETKGKRDADEVWGRERRED